MSTTTQRPQRARALPPEQRRESIVAATAPLLVEHGSAVTSRQIAEAAGIAEGTIFRVFTDKDEVISATVESLLDPAPLEAAIAAIDLALPLTERLERAIAILQDRVFTVWQVLSAAGPRFQHVARPVQDSEALRELLEPDAARLRIDAAAAARRLRSMAMALTHPMVITDPVDAADIVDMFLYGLSTEARSCS